MRITIADGSSPYLGWKETGAGGTNMTQHEQFPRLNDDFLLFALKSDVWLFVCVSWSGPF